MPILVYLRDGRTLLLIAKRGFLGRLMKHEPDNEEGSISVKRAQAAGGFDVGGRGVLGDADRRLGDVAQPDLLDLPHPLARCGIPVA